MEPILVSACLLGIPCRYDGASQPDPEIQALAIQGKIIPVCPEVAGGLPTPRPPAEIVGGDGAAVLDGSGHVVTVDGNDVTEAFLRGAQAALEAALSAGAGKAILRAHSPSCGVEAIYDGTFSGRLKPGMGVTAALLTRHGIPVESRIPPGVAEPQPSAAPDQGRRGKMRIAVGSDHAGFTLKNLVKEHLIQLGYEVEDVGTHSEESCDYPDFAIEVARRVASGRSDLGILICGTGIGMGIVANKVPGVRAAVCHDAYTARMSRAHNAANVLCMGARVLGIGVAMDVVQTFIETPFSEAERHRRRVAKIAAIEAETLQK